MHLLWRTEFGSLVKIESTAEGWSWCVALICVKWADRHEQIAQWTPSFSLARTAHCVSMTVYMSCWHNALYDGRTASSLLLCTVSTLEARYAQLTPTDEFQTSWVLLTHYIDCLFKFDDSRKCILLLSFSPSPHVTLCYTHWLWWWLAGSKHLWKNWFETDKHYSWSFL